MIERQGVPARRSLPGRLRFLTCVGILVYLTFLGTTAATTVSLGMRIFHQVFISIWLGWWLVGLIRSGEGLPTTGLEAPLLFLTAVRLLSCCFGIDPRMSLEIFWRSIIHLLAFYWMVWTLRRWGQGFLLRVLFLAAATVLIVALTEFVSWYLGLPFLTLFQQGWLEIGGLSDPVPPVFWRLTFTLSNANVLAGYLALLFPPALAMALTAKQRDRKVAWVIWMAAALVVLGLTRSRGGLLTLVVSLIAFGLGVAVVCRERLSARIDTLGRRRVALGLGLVLVLAVGSGLAYVGLVSWHRTSTIQVRWELWRCALVMLADHPFTGIGSGAFGHALRSCVAIQSNSYENMATAHNLYLNLAAESGVLAVGGMVWLMVGIVRRLWKRWQSAESVTERLWLVGISSALLGFATNGLVEAIPETPYVLPVILLLALVTGPPTLTVSKQRARLASAVAAGAVVVLYAAALGWADWAQQHLERSLRWAARADWTAALAQIEQARAMDPYLDLYDFQRGYYLGRLAVDNPASYLGPAIQATATALESEHTYSVHLANAAALGWQAGQADRALALMAQAARANPPNPICWLNLGLIAESLGREEEAVDAYATVLGMRPEWAGSDFWQATAFRQERNGAILTLAIEQGADPVSLWLAVGELERARQVSRDPQSAQDNVRLGSVLLESGQAAGALQAAERAISQSPASASAYVLRARAYLALGRGDLATRDAHIALFISPQGAVGAHLVLGCLAEAEGDLQTAKDHYWQALAPEYVSQNWEVVLYSRRALLLPLPQLVRISGGTREFQPWLRLADLYLAEDRPAEAAGVYRLLLERDPFSLEAQARLDELLAAGKVDG